MKIVILTLSIVGLLILGVGMYGVYDFVTLKQLQKRCLEKIEEVGVRTDVTFEGSATSKQLEAVRTQISTIDGVTNVSITTAEQALADFNENLKNNPGLRELTKDLGDTNPLTASMTIEHHADTAINDIVRKIRQSAKNEGVPIIKLYPGDNSYLRNAISGYKFDFLLVRQVADLKGNQTTRNDAIKGLLEECSK